MVQVLIRAFSVFSRWMHSVETDESEFHELLISALKSIYNSVKTHYKSVISFTVWLV